MAIVASGFSSDCALVHFVCPTAAAAAANHQCGEYSNSCAPWAVPTSAVLPLCYWVLLNSCLVYWMITWANQHAKAGFVLAYCALQPLVAMLLSAVRRATPSPDPSLPTHALACLLTPCVSPPRPRHALPRPLFSLSGNPGGGRAER